MTVCIPFVKVGWYSQVRLLIIQSTIVTLPPTHNWQIICNWLINNGLWVSNSCPKKHCDPIARQQRARHAIILQWNARDPNTDAKFDKKHLHLKFKDLNSPLCAMAKRYHHNCKLSPRPEIFPWQRTSTNVVFHSPQFSLFCNWG